jgi:hypothetical protein
MASLADLYSFLAMVWMYINAAMQQCAVLRMGGDDISVAVVKFGHYEWGTSMQGVCRYPFDSKGECMASLANLYSFLAMVWMYINAATQQCAVLRSVAMISVSPWSSLAMM